VHYACDQSLDFLYFLYLGYFCPNLAILMYKFEKYPTVLDLNTKFYIYEVKMLRKYTLNLRFKKNP